MPENLLLQALACLPIMTRLAERTPVGLIPEQLLVTAVRDNVIDHGGRRQPICLQALRAERVFPKKKGARLSPAPVVAALRRRFAGVLLSVLLTIGRVAEVGAAGMTARALRFSRHANPPYR